MTEANQKVTGSFTIGDLDRDELTMLAWSGSATHLENIAHQLDRRATGTVEYLVVRDSTGTPVAKCGVDYEDTHGAGTIFQLATRQDLEGQGLGTRLIATAERRIADRGLSLAHLAVEPENERAIRLYDYLGYKATGEREIGWEREGPDGVRYFHRTRVVWMEKTIPRR